jgi:hypothetical protein
MATRQRPPLNTSLAADVRVARSLRVAGGHSPLCRAFRVALREEGVGRLTRLDSVGRLLEEVAGAGHALYVPVPVWYPGHAGFLIQRTASVASRAFVDVDILEGKWSPDEGVPIRDAFILACYCTFARQYNQFCRRAQGGAA